MKCSNCGFDFEGKFCPMCGTKISEESTINNVNPYQAQPNFAQSEFPAQNFNPIQQEANQNSFPTQNSNFEQPSIPPLYENGNAALNTEYIVNNSQSDYPNEQAQSFSSKRKFHRILGITCTSVVALVAIAGIAINFFSSFYEKSITDTLFENSSNDFDSSYDYTQYYGKPVGIGETAGMESTKLKATKIEAKDFTKEQLSDYSDYVNSGSAYCLNVTFEITNTGKNSVDYDLPYEMSAFPEDDSDAYFPVMDTSSDSTLITVESGETKSYSIDIAVSSYAKSIILTYDHYNDYDDESESCCFKLDLPEQNNAVSNSNKQN